MNTMGLHPQPSGMYDMYGLGQLPNPFYTVANQFIPRNYHDVIKWSRYVLTQSPTVAEVVRKISSYPITDFNIHSPKEAVKKSYEEIIKSVKLKQKLSDIGFDYYSLGNTFTSVYFPIDRHVVCPSCKTSYECRYALESNVVRFKRYEFEGECPHCQFKGKFKRIDRKSRDISRINLIKWAPDKVALNHNEITGDTDYYYTIPGSTKRKIQMGDPMFISTVPWDFIDAVRLGKDVKFDNSNFYHMKSISLGSMLEGMGMPIIISLYGMVFYQAMLRKANEAVAAEHMVPMRVIFPQQGTNKGDPVAMMSMAGFTQNVKKSMMHFKKDPNHLLISPVPVGYQSIGGQGRSLLVSQEMQYAEETMLMGMGVSRELLSGTTNWTSSDVGLRLLENNMNHYVGQMREFLDWFFTMVSQYLGLEIVPVEMTPFRLTDNVQLQQMMAELWKAQLVSASTFLDSLGIDYTDEMKKLASERIAAAEREIKTTHQIDVAKFMANKDVTNEGQDDNGYRENMDMAFEVAQQMMQSRTQEEFEQGMFKLQRNDPTLYSAVLNILQQHSASMSGASAPGDEGEVANENMS